MIGLSYYGCVTDDTFALVEKWKESDLDRGVFGSGELTAQEQVTAMTYASGALREAHAKSARICKGTATAEDLRKTYGMANTDARRREVLRYVSVMSGDDEVVVENGLCEKNREFNACEALLGGMLLYRMMGGDLYGTDAGGITSRIPARNWQWDRLDYGAGVRWWDHSVNISSLTGEIILSVEE